MSTKSDVEALAQATLNLAKEIRMELQLPEKFKAERELEELIAKQDFVASVARGVMGKGSPEDVENAKKALGIK